MIKLKNILSPPPPILNECIIVSRKINNDVILAKNRDRMYIPVVKIKHKLINDIEIVYMHDLTTGWAEGMNEYGIGIVNTALMVGRDEGEKKIVKKQGKPSRDGKHIVNALLHDKIEDVLKHIIDKSVKGHTFIASPKKLYIVELTSKHQKAFIAERDINGWYVRTNHGFHYPDAGYTTGEKYLSSKIRKISAETLKGEVTSAEDLLDKMAVQYYEKDSSLNMRRTTKTMRTTSQIAMNLTKKQFIFKELPNEVKFQGVVLDLPKDYKPKIDIIIK